MLAAISPVRTLLIAILMLTIGSGFMATIVGLRLQAAGVSVLGIGLVATAYFAGLTIGSLRVSNIIQRVGHIRSFAAFVALLSASTLAYGVQQSLPLWGVLRFIDGLSMAGVFVCMESWLNERAEPRTRGAVLAAYMIALYAGQAIGQFLLNLGGARAALPFMVASILISLSIIPIALARIAEPKLGDSKPLPFRALYSASPLGIVGTIVTGLMLGAFYALGAVCIRRFGLSVPVAALFMSMVIAGGVALQWPIGWLSDRFDRRRVIVWAFAGAVVASFAIALPEPHAGPLLVLGAVFGGLSFALYPLCVAHTNDHLSNEDRVGASGGLVLAYSVGAAAGPMAGATTMALAGPGGLFLFIGCCAAGALLFALWRQSARGPVKAELQGNYQILPRTTPASAMLDPVPREG